MLLRQTEGSVYRSNEQPLPTPEMRSPLSLSLSPCVALFSSAPVYSPSSLPCVHGHWLGFGVALVGEDAGGQGGNRDVVRGCLWGGRRRQGKEGRELACWSKGGAHGSKQGVPPSPRLSCSDCGARPGRAAACAVMCVCALCAYAMHLADNYPHIHCAGVRQCMLRLCAWGATTGITQPRARASQPAIRCCVAVGTGGTLISSCRSSCGGACGRGRACGGGPRCSWAQIRSREPR